MEKYNSTKHINIPSFRNDQNNRHRRNNHSTFERDELAQRNLSYDHLLHGLDGVNRNYHSKNNYPKALDPLNLKAVNLQLRSRSNTK